MDLRSIKIPFAILKVHKIWNLKTCFCRGLTRVFLGKVGMVQEDAYNVGYGFLNL